MGFFARIGKAKVYSTKNGVKVSVGKKKGKKQAALQTERSGEMLGRSFCRNHTNRLIFTDQVIMYKIRL